MKILFLGSFLPSKYENRFEHLSAAANQFQYNLYKAASENNQVKVLSYITAPEVNLSASDGAELREKSFAVYTPKAKGLSQFFKYRLKMWKYIKQCDRVLIYNMVYAWFGIGLIAKLFNKKSILIFADYTPAYEENSISKKLYAVLSKLNFRWFDKVVILSEGSRKYVNSTQETLLFHGCVDWELFKNIKPIENKEIYNIVYTGFIGHVTGVDLLLEAFNKIDGKNLRLYICGQGNELDYLIEEYINKDDRIIYNGYLSKEDYIKTLEDANLLVNPRNMNLSQNQNNFPSKILEYIASGRPIVSTKFIGWEEFEGNCLFAESNVDNMILLMNEAISLSDFETLSLYKKNRIDIKKYIWTNWINTIIK